MARESEIRLEFHNEKSSKQYTIWIDAAGGHFDVWTEWGRTSDDTPELKKRNAKPLNREGAEKEYARVAREKLKKGYELVRGTLPSFVEKK